MKLTKKKAIDISIELWAWLAETGKKKPNWTGWEKYGEMKNRCPLCEYANKDCVNCSYYKRFEHCMERAGIYQRWLYAVKTSTRKKYASLFLEQLKELK
ncbi:hypothetical protein LCGC14_2255790 [marine sediment metagenome]|uniref:Uncharacterized protein n=1 Tax=marine sediment metagenome TaxID=412755 RepID=A0A0F9DNN0_9ZZZZ